MVMITFSRHLCGASRSAKDRRSNASETSWAAAVLPSDQPTAGFKTALLSKFPQLWDDTGVTIAVTMTF